MIKLGEMVMILDLHRQGLSVSAIARDSGLVLAAMEADLPPGLAPAVAVLAVGAAVTRAAQVGRVLVHPGARVCDVAGRYRVTGQQLTTRRRAAREGLLALPGDAVGADDLGLVSVEVEAQASASAEAASPDRGDRGTARFSAGPDDRIEIVAGGVLVRLPAATVAARVAEIAVALGARL